MLVRPLTFHAPHTIVEAAQLQATLKEARILAGGTFLLNSPKLTDQAQGPYSARGLGEASLLPTSAAIANAIEDACGVRIKKLQEKNNITENQS